MKKLLYISSWHSTLEHDEVVAFLEMGYEVFSTGHYLNPHEPVKEEGLRDPILIGKPNLELIAKFNALNPQRKVHYPIKLTKDFVDNFDFIVFGHCCPLPNELSSLWPYIKHKPVLFRTYGQQGPDVELQIAACHKAGKLVRVRVASTESIIPKFAGTDFVIKGYVDEDRYTDWNGSNKDVLTFNNFFRQRTWHSNTRVYIQARNLLPDVKFSLYGLYNESVGLCKGVLSQDEQIEAYKACGVYFSLGSKPAALTYSIVEAMMVGCPVVTWGRTLGAGTPNIYEVPFLFENGIDCFMAESASEASFYIKTLLDNPKLSADMSTAARKAVMKICSKGENKRLWQEAIDFALK